MYLSAQILKLFHPDAIYFYNIISIGKGFDVQILEGCNFTKHLGIFLNFFVSYPGGIVRMMKYILVCFLFLFIFQIFRIISFTVCIKYFPHYWDFFHYNSTYLFYYPITLFLWYKYSSKTYV